MEFIIDETVSKQVQCKADCLSFNLHILKQLVVVVNISEKNQHTCSKTVCSCVVELTVILSNWRVSFRITCSGVVSPMVIHFPWKESRTARIQNWPFCVVVFTCWTTIYNSAFQSLFFIWYGVLFIIWLSTTSYNTIQHHTTSYNIIWCHTNQYVEESLYPGF